MWISTPQLRSVISQLCAIFPYYILNFVEGTSQGFEIILLAELYKTDSEIPMSIDQLTWLPSLSFLAPLGSLATGFSTQRLGSRSMALVTSVFYIVAWMLLHYSTSATVTFSGRVFGIITATNALATPYISEISEPQFRSKFLAICQMTRGFGSFFSLLLNSFVYWRTIALVNLAFPILAAVTVLATPNSPAWLTSKGRLVEAEEALCWLRGWVEPNRVRREFSTLTDVLQKSSPTTNNQVEITGCRARSSHFFQLFLRPSFYLPLVIICTIFLLQELTGVAAIHTYSAIVFPKIHSPIDVSIATVIMSVTVIVGNLIIILFVRRTGKRKLVFASVLVVALCYASTGVIGFFELQNGYYLWVPSIAIIIANLANSSGAGGVVHMVVSEIFPSPVRYIGTSIGASIYFIIMSAVNKSFLYVVDAITLPGTFLVFASINVVALIAYYFVFPETEGRSLTEIEDHFKGVSKNMKECEK